MSRVQQGFQEDGRCISGDLAPLTGNSNLVIHVQQSLILAQTNEIGGSHEGLRVGTGSNHRRRSNSESFGVE